MEAQTLAIFISFLLFTLLVIVYKGYLSQIGLKNDSLNRPKLSLIIALKNEENNVYTLKQSVEKLKYPNEEFEVIFVDDNSSDETYEKLNELISGKPNYFLLKANNKNFPGKKGALQFGIEKSKNDFIVITDADCKPESNWLLKISQLLSSGYDFVFSVAPIRSGKTFVEKLSAFENLRTTFLTISAVGLNTSYSAAARSFAFRKSSFEKIGGYSNTIETLSGDDDLLLREAVKHKMKIGTIIEPDAFVFSDPPKSFKEYFKQKKRHLQTSFHYLPKQKIFLGFWHLINLISFFSFLLIFISPIFVLPFIIKMIYDFIIVSKHQNQLGHNFKVYEVPLLQFSFEIFLIINFINSLFGKVEWK